MEIESQIAADRERAAAERQREMEKTELSRRRNEVEVGGKSVVRRPASAVKKIGGVTVSSSPRTNGANGASGGGGSVVKKPVIKRKGGRAF
ncbi:hypothetical protein BJX64DRAFT_156502 [Aspergillus heterothallicus]